MLPPLRADSNNPSVAYKKYIQEEDVDDSEYIPHQRPKRHSKVKRRRGNSVIVFLVL